MFYCLFLIFVFIFFPIWFLVLLNFAICIGLCNKLIKAQHEFMVCLMTTKSANIGGLRFLENRFDAQNIYCQINFLCNDCETSHNRDIKSLLDPAYSMSNETTDERLRDIFLSFDLFIGRPSRPKGINILRTTFSSSASFYS